MFFDGEIQPVNISNLGWLGNTNFNSDYLTNNSVIQDAINQYGVVSLSPMTYVTTPYIKESNYSKDTLGNVYTGMSNTYLTKDLETYSVGDVINYTPRYAKLEFKNKPLHEIISELNAYYKVKFIVPESLLNESITLTIDQLDALKTADLLSKVLNVKVEVE
jgi:hypothetical protein